MLLDTHDHIQWHIYYYGVYEPEETRWLKQFLKPGMVVFDVGGNIGYFTVIMSKLVGQNGSVHTFEATSHAYNRLKEHAIINNCQNVVMNHSAVSNRTGQCKIYCAGDTNTGQSSLCNFKSSKTEEIVTCFPLDYYIKERGIDKVDFIKIDVEGAEMLVIEGATSLLERLHPTIMMEINPPALARMDSSGADLIKKMTRAGYDMYAFDKTALQPCRDKDITLAGKDNANFVFIPRGAGRHAQ